MINFKFINIKTLPPLAWCAKIEKENPIISVWHGSKIETFNHGFVEGAWDDSFDQYNFDQAVTFTGSGGKIIQEKVIFSTPSHPLERLYSAQVDQSLYISNSVNFLAVQIKVEPYLNYPNYFFDFFNYFRKGITEPDKYIIFTNQQKIYFHIFCNLIVKSDLTIERMIKNINSPFQNFNDYEKFLQNTVQKVINNGIDTKRKNIYKPITTISKGYDSAAVSVLASRAGCREAVTFKKSGDLARNYVDDNGSEIAQYLNLNVTEYERRDYFKLDNPPDAEFNFFALLTSDKTFAVMEEQIKNSLLMTGKTGLFWMTNEKKVLPFFQVPDQMLIYMLGSTLLEFRLRLGFFHFPVPYCGAFHNSSIYQITCSEEMKAWRLGGDYDKPIPRRIIESTGVPRELFGQNNFGGAANKGKKLPPKSEADFFNFYEQNVKPIEHKLDYGLENKSHDMWGLNYLYIFHWGFHKIKSRY